MHVQNISQIAKVFVMRSRSKSFLIFCFALFFVHVQPSAAMGDRPERNSEYLNRTTSLNACDQDIVNVDLMRAQKTIPLEIPRAYINDPTNAFTREKEKAVFPIIFIIYNGEITCVNNDAAAQPIDLSIKLQNNNFDSIFNAKKKRYATPADGITDLYETYLGVKQKGIEQETLFLPKDKSHKYFFTCQKGTLNPAVKSCLIQSFVTKDIYISYGIKDHNFETIEQRNKLIVDFISTLIK